jgi:hypothetical protein
MARQLMRQLLKVVKTANRWHGGRPQVRVPEPTVGGASNLANATEPYDPIMILTSGELALFGIGGTLLGAALGATIGGLSTLSANKRNRDLQKTLTEQTLENQRILASDSRTWERKADAYEALFREIEATNEILRTPADATTSYWTEPERLVAIETARAGLGRTQAATYLYASPVPRTAWGGYLGELAMLQAKLQLYAKQGGRFASIDGSPTDPVAGVESIKESAEKVLESSVDVFEGFRRDLGKRPPAVGTGAMG